MVSETTIIPQEIKVDGVTIDKNGTGQLQIKEDSNNPIIKDIALNELNITVLEVNASLSSINDDFIENFIDADGLLNLVDTGNTTSSFVPSKAYLNIISSILFSDITTTTTISTLYVLMKTIQCEDKYILKITNELQNSGMYETGCYIKYYYTDATTEDSQINTTNNAGYVLKTYTNPNVEKTVTKVEVYLKTSSASYTAYEQNDNIYGALSPSSTSIYLNYNKAKPIKTLLTTFSDDTGKADVGTYTYELVHIGTAETTGELNPDIENTISMTNTPDRMIIHQKDTAVSKIKKFVLAVWE